MKHLHSYPSTILPHFVRDLQTQYITELQAISSLAPCASSALASIVQQLTSSQCLSSRTDLATCACTELSATVTSSIASGVAQTCGTTASEDVSSALTVFSVYCTGGSDATFEGIPISSVTEYIENISAMSTVGQCASSGVVSVIHSLTVALCPAPPTALISCACFKNDNSAAASSSIQSRVAELCGTTATAEITGALGVFSAYCAMASPATTAPPSATTTATAKGNGSTLSQTHSPAPAVTSLSAGSIAGITVGTFCVVMVVLVFLFKKRISSWLVWHRDRFNGQNKSIPQQTELSRQGEESIPRRWSPKPLTYSNLQLEGEN